MSTSQFALVAVTAISILAMSPAWAVTASIYASSDCTGTAVSTYDYGAADSCVASPLPGDAGYFRVRATKSGSCVSTQNSCPTKVDPWWPCDECLVNTTTLVGAPISVQHVCNSTHATVVFYGNATVCNAAAASSLSGTYGISSATSTCVNGTALVSSCTYAVVEHHSTAACGAADKTTGFICNACVRTNATHSVRTTCGAATQALALLVACLVLFGLLF